jgi:DNA-binding protein H-NS
MEADAFKSMSTDEMWHLHEQMTSILARKMAEEKAKLEERLRRLENARGAIGPNRPRVPIRRFFRNTRTQKIMPKHGRAVESNRIGYGRGSARAKSSSIFLLLEPSNERRHILKMARTSA